MSTANAPVKSLTAYNLIREAILSGELLPGTRLVLADLETHFGVGRGPLREAVLRLDKSGLVQNIPYKGAVVMPPPSYPEMAIIYQLRVRVEVEMAVEAMRQASEASIDRLEALSAEMGAAMTDEPLFFHHDREFHSQLYALAKMPHLQILVDRLLDHAESFLNSYAYASQDKALFYEQHQSILTALRSKDEALLRHVLEQNILAGLALVQNEMERFRQRRQGLA